MNSARALALRLYLGLSVQQLADSLGVDPRSVRRWESPDNDGPPGGLPAELDALHADYETTLDALEDLPDDEPIVIPPHPDAPRPEWAVRTLPHHSVLAAAGHVAFARDRALQWSAGS